MILPNTAVPIIDNSGYYITPHGKIYSAWHKRKGGRKGEMYIDTSSVHEIKQHVVKGYWQVYIGRMNQKVHRLLKITFDPIDCPKKYLVCHKNGNSLDNRLENLYWGSPKTNSHDMMLHGTRLTGSSSSLASFTVDGVHGVFSMYFKDKMTMDEISKKTGKSRATISRVLNGWTYKAETAYLAKRRPVKYQRDRLLKLKNKLIMEHRNGSSYNSLAIKYNFGKNQVWRICNNLSYQK